MGMKGLYPARAETPAALRMHWTLWGTSLRNGLRRWRLETALAIHQAATFEPLGRNARGADRSDGQGACKIRILFQHLRVKFDHVVQIVVIALAVIKLKVEFKLLLVDIVAFEHKYTHDDHSSDNREYDAEDDSQILRTHLRK
eukprot:5146656-Pleurochrysis_carterae.AAC.1